MNFDELILDAAKSIAAATAALIKAASEAQKELVAQGKVSRTSVIHSEDGQWSEGLVSAARLVASATHNLCEAANAMVRGDSSEEKLIAAAKQVAGSTAQLLLACKVKADPESRSMRRLEVASNAVRKATENLVRDAQQSLEQDDDSNVQKLSMSGVRGQAEVSLFRITSRPHFCKNSVKRTCKKTTFSISQLIDAQAKVIEMERMLMEAQNKVKKLTKDQSRPYMTESETEQSG